MKIQIVFLFIVALTTTPVIAQNAEDSIEILLSKTPTYKNKIELLINASKKFQDTDLSKSLEYAFKALELSKNEYQKLGEIRSLVRLSEYYLEIRDFRKAIDYAENSKRLALDNEFLSEIGNINSVLSKIYYALGDFAKSTSYDFENLEYFEKTKDQIGIGATLGNIGIDFYNQNNFDKALEYLNKSLEIAIKNNDSIGIAYQYNTIGGVYYEHYKDYEKSLFYFKEALKVNNYIKNQKQVAINKMNIASAFLMNKWVDSSLVYYLDARDFFETNNDNLLLAECNTGIGEYFYSIGNFEEAIKYTNLAFNISNSINAKENILLASDLLHKIYLSKKDTISAYKYHILASKISDSLGASKNLKELFLLEFQYNYDKIEKQRLIKTQQKNFIIGIIISSLISLILIIILIYLKLKIKAKSTILEKEKMEVKFNFKKKELVINLMALLKKNQMLDEISKKLKLIKNDALNKETKDAVIQISKEIQKSSDNKILKELAMQFQESHSEFYEKLLLKYPNLSQNDLKICAYLRLNMSTKEISELTGSRKLTVENARYRLRKKLGITNSETNLVTFLLQI